MMLPLPRLAARPLALVGRRGLDLEDHAVDTATLPAPLAAALDRIEAARLYAPAHMRRRAEDWSLHLSIAGARSYRFCVAHRGGEPMGYVVVRRLTPGSSNQLGKVAAAMITDLVAVNHDQMVLRALAAPGHG